MLAFVTFGAAALASSNPESLDQSLLTAEDVRADLDALYAGLEAAHYDLFAHRSRQEYDTLYETLQASIQGPMPRLEALRLLQRFAAFGDVAHARIDLPAHYWSEYRQGGGRALPIYPRIIDGRVYVGEYYARTRSEPGVQAPLLEDDDQVTAIEGEPVAAWLTRLGQYHAADTDYMLHSFLERTFPRDLWLELGDVDAVTLTVRSKTGDRRVVQVPTMDSETLSRLIEATAPRFELDYGRSFRIEGGVAILRPGPFFNINDPADPWNTTAFLAFLDDAFTQILDAGVVDLIIDLRDNPGGDNSFSDPLVAWFADKPFRFASYFEVRSSHAAERANAERLAGPAVDENSVSARYARAYAETEAGETFVLEIDEVQPRQERRFTGRVWVLVNRRSYSTAVTTAALIQDYEFGTIIGEPTSDFATTYGAMEHFELPHSGIRVGFPKALIVRPSGDRSPGGVVPDRVIETPLVPGTEDEVMAAALRLIAAADPDSGEHP